jgi:signal transduction histidine kinase
MPDLTRLQEITRWCGGLVSGLGGIALLGWVFGWELATRVLPGMATMKPNTACGLMLVGAALVLMARPATWRLAVAAALGLLVISLAAVLLADILLELPWDPNQWLVTDPSLEQTPVPGQPSPATALGLLSLGIAILLSLSPRRSTLRLAGAVALVPVCLASVALVGYLYSVNALYQATAGTTAMALNTVIALLAAAAGIFAANPRIGIVSLLVSPTAGGRMFRFLFPNAVLALLLIGWIRIVAESSGLIAPEQGTAAFVLGALVVLAVLVIRHAREADAVEVRENEAQQRREEFLAMLAHELRNPLAAISSSARILEHVGLEGRGRRAQQTIRRQGDLMARLVDGLLDLSRLTRGRIELHRRPVDLADLLSRLVEEEAPELEHRAQEVRLQVRGPAVVEGDPVRLEQVFTNLISNASHFAPPNTSILVEDESDGRGDVAISVGDQGPGISADDRELIFEPFYQSSHSLARSGGGLGIGLTLARQIVELHGGTLTVDSDERGSRFTVRLPSRRSDSSAERKDSSPSRRRERTVGREVRARGPAGRKGGSGRGTAGPIGA